MASSPIITARFPSNGHREWVHSDLTMHYSRKIDLVPETTQRSFPLTWHHQIPFNSLRDFWNWLYVIADDDLLDMCVDLFSQRAKGGRFPEIKRKLKVIKTTLMPTLQLETQTYSQWKAVVAQIANGLLAPADELDGEEQSDLFEAISWSSWNILEGPLPQHRSDDPGDANVDDFSHLREIKFSKHFIKTAELYASMILFINEMNAQQNQNYSKAWVKDRAKKLLTILTGADQLLFSVKITFFNKKHWSYQEQMTGRTPVRATVLDNGATWYRWRRCI
ncbi:hypothetical protein HUW52_19955 [Pseudomonas sp. 43A]|uniref:hypothetical protein n=1 Tax=unclassified Pseudomonas TaxID=196821 RepID=UPI0015877743|nr:MULTISPECIES: hypothetical protein [unclassified Pseudomonas]QKV65065.1 hypothetical protein HUW52_19955 [Pseudomonas sp. 43A]QMW12481.1 hypothetical protein H3303_12745 [Pseudomonas sp. 29A]